MKELIKRAIARRLGLVTQAEAMELVRNNVTDFRGRVYAITQVLTNERIAIFKENKRLKDELRDAEEYITHLRNQIIKGMKMTTPEQPTIKGDF